MALSTYITTISGLFENFDPRSLLFSMHMPSSGIQNEVVTCSFKRAFDKIEICDCLFNQCTLRSLFRLRRTCKTAKCAIDDYVSRAYDINHFLSRFFEDPSSFRDLQALTDAVISGSAALQFLDRTEYIGSDLDIYVTKEHVLTVCNWLMDSSERRYRFDVPPGQVQMPLLAAIQDIELRSRTVEGVAQMRCIDDSASDQNIYNENKIWAVLDFVSRDAVKQGEPLQVQVIVTMHSPAASILNFHSTVVMNLITYYGAYSLYPRATYDERRSLVCCTRPRHRKDAIDKYAKRGWKIQRKINPVENEDTNASFRIEDRWIGDKKTWFIPFETNLQGRNVHSPTSLLYGIDPIVLNSFSLEKNPGRTACEMQFSVLRPDFFGRCYTASFNLSRKMSLFFEMITACGLHQALVEPIDHTLLRWKQLMPLCLCSFQKYDIPDNTQKFKVLECPAFDPDFSALAQCQYLQD